MGLAALIGVPSIVVGLLFALGLVMSWLLQRLVHLERQIDGARTELGRLREVGVGYRNKAREGFADKQSHDAWIATVSTWNDDVVSAIAKFSKADALWFGTLDVVPEPRLGLSIYDGYWDDDGIDLYSFHDFRLLCLGELLVRTQAPTTATASI